MKLTTGFDAGIEMLDSEEFTKHVAQRLSEALMREALDVLSVEEEIAVKRPDYIVRENPSEYSAAIRFFMEVTPIVRCKNCKHFAKDLCWHELDTSKQLLNGFPIPRKSEDFCSYGEKRANES